MCKILFPEYVEIQITSSFPYYNCNKLEGIQLEMPKLQLAWFENPKEDAVSLIYKDNDDYRSKTIHYFELSWKILNQLCIGKTPIQINNLVHHFGLVCFNNASSLHPIDYLYGIFIVETKETWE